MNDKLLIRLEDKTLTKGTLHQIVEHNLDLIPVLVKGMYSQKPSIRYGCGKVLMDLSEKYPERILPYLESFIELLDSKYRIITWNAMAIIANISRSDHEKKIDNILKKYINFLSDEYMVTVVNAIGNLGKIALAKPYLTQKIVDEILKVENVKINPHLTEECQRVIVEKAIGSFDLLYDKIGEKKKVLSFVERQVNSSRKSLRNKAVEFVKKYCE